MRILFSIPLAIAVLCDQAVGGVQDVGDKSVCHVTGTVVDNRGQPLAGVGVILGIQGTLRTADCVDQPLARTDERGRYEFVLGWPRKDTRREEVLAYGPGWAAAKVRAPAFTYTDPEAVGERDGAAAMLEEFANSMGARPGEAVVPPIVLDPGVDLGGRVVDQDGAPVEGAWITARDLLTQSHFTGLAQNDPTDFSYAVSGPDGRYRLPGVVRSGARLSLDVEGYYRLSVDVAGAADDLELVLQRAARVTGQVFDSEEMPLQSGGASISVHYEASPQPHRVVADEAGRFDAYLHYPLRFRLRVDPAGNYRSGHQRTFSAIHLGTQEDLRVVLEPKAPTEEPPAPPAPTEFELKSKLGFPVTVVDKGTGAPLAGFYARSVWRKFRQGYNANTLFSWARSANVKSEQPGYIRLEGPPKPQETHGIVVIRCDGYAPFVHDGVEWDPGDIPRLRAELVRESKVTGVVRDEVSGDPIAGASLTMERPLDLGRDRLSTTTDQDGRFTFSQLHAASYSLTAHHNGQTSQARRVTLQAEEHLSDVSVLMPHPNVVRGRIFGIETPPGTQVELLDSGTAESLHRNPWYQPVGQRSALEQDGSFELKGVSPGVFEVCLLVPSAFRRGEFLRTLLEPIRVRKRDVELEIDATADRPGMLNGAIELPGAQIPYARLLVIATPFALGTSSYGNQVRIHGFKSTVGADGGFAVEVVPGEYKLKILDVITGLVLEQTEVPVRVDADQTVTEQFELPLAEVRVNIEPKEAGGLDGASSLGVQLATPRTPGAFGLVLLSNPDSRLTTGVSLLGRTDDVVLFLPPREVTLRASAELTRLSRGRARMNSNVGELKFVPELGKPNAVVVEVDIPTTGFDAGEDR